MLCFEWFRVGAFKIAGWWEIVVFSVDSGRLLLSLKCCLHKPFLCAYFLQLSTEHSRRHLQPLYLLLLWIAPILSVNFCRSIFAVKCRWHWPSFWACVSQFLTEHNRRHWLPENMIFTSSLTSTSFLGFVRHCHIKDIESKIEVEYINNYTFLSRIKCDCDRVESLVFPLNYSTERENVNYSLIRQNKLSLKHTNDSVQQCIWIQDSCPGEWARQRNRSNLKGSDQSTESGLCTR